MVRQGTQRGSNKQAPAEALSLLSRTACLQSSLFHGSRATDALAAGRLDTTTALQQAQLVAVANDGLNKRDVAEQQQLVVEVANLMAQQAGLSVQPSAGRLLDSVVLRWGMESGQGQTSCPLDK